MAMREKIEELRARRQRLQAGGGAARIAKQHAAGKLTARERIDLLLEEDTFQEANLYAEHRTTRFGMAGKELPGEGVVTGHGLVDGRAVYVASQDFTVAGGSVGEATANKIAAVMDWALKTGDPFVFINDGAGARIQEGVDALAGYGRIFYRNVALSGVVPQISIIAGPCAGGGAYSPALTDFIIQVRGTGQMYITGPKVIEQVTGEKITAEELGGAGSHATHSGVVHFVAESDEDAIQIAKRLLSFLPSNNSDDPPYYPHLREEAIAPDPALDTIVPDEQRQPYDVRDVIHHIVDQADFLEVHAAFAPNIVVGFARIMGHSIGIIASQPKHMAGSLDINASDKASAHIRFCNAFNIPIVTLVDVPGFLPGVQQEYGGIIRHGAKMLFAYAAATVPKVTVVLRKAYGGAYLAMCSKDMGADRFCSWPSGEIAVMGAQGAVSVLYRKEIAAAEDAAAARGAKIDEYNEQFANPYVAAAHGLVDEVIEPSETRAYLAAALEILRKKREIRPSKKHGLTPL